MPKPFPEPDGNQPRWPSPGNESADGCISDGCSILYSPSNSSEEDLESDNEAGFLRRHSH